MAEASVTTAPAIAATLRRLAPGVWKVDAVAGEIGGRAVELDVSSPPAVAEVLADVPKLYSGVLPVDAVAPLGFELMMPLGTMLAAYGAVRDAMQELRDTGAVARGGDLATLDEMLAVLGLRELRAFEDTHA